MTTEDLSNENFFVLPEQELKIIFSIQIQVKYVKQKCTAVDLDNTQGFS